MRLKYFLWERLSSLDNQRRVIAAGKPLPREQKTTSSSDISGKTPAVHLELFTPYIKAPFADLQCPINRFL
jgi:hypothetical protein